MADETHEPGPGITETLAEARAKRVRDLRYALTLSIPRNREHPIHGRAELTFRLSDAAQPLVLDFAPGAPGALLAASVNGTNAALEVRDGHVHVAPALLRRGVNQLDLTFVAGDAPLNRRDDLLYSLFVPARAHEALPCFDQPSLRARWSLSFEIPTDWSIVSNAPELSRRTIRDSSGHPRVAVTFAETEPLPTYLVAFAAGRFDLASRDCAGRPMQMLHREADPEVLAGSLDAIAQLHEQSLSWLHSYTGIPYPFAKLDAVLVPAFQFSGMEHPGAVYYNAGSVLLDKSATRQQLLARAHLIAHETTHMWFGNLVTMRWFSDVWMKEVFANFLAAKIVASLFPDIDHELAFLHGHYPPAYDVDRTAGSNPIRQPLDNLLNAASLYGPIVYLKSPIVMRQLEHMVGADTLRDASRQFLQTFRYKSASWPDLLTILQRRTLVDLTAWSRDWIDEPGRPTVQTTIDDRDGAIVRLVLEGPASRWPQHLWIALGYLDRVDHVPAYLDGRADVLAARGRPLPDFVLPNGRGTGYGDFRLDTRSREWLLANLPAIVDPLTRASAWITLWDAMLNGEAAQRAIMDLALRSLAAESSDLTITRVLGYMEKTFWIFFSAAERHEYAPRIEHALRVGIDRAADVPLKAALLAALRAVATTARTLRWLEALWRRDKDIPGLPIGESDRIALAQELAVREWQDPDELVQTQIDLTADPDRRDALLFLKPALSRSLDERDRFFSSLRDIANRRREPWVVDGLRWLHHPLRQHAALPWIEPGLEMLEEVQRTGDIFFPKRWADAILSGHSSPEAARAVRRFLDSRPASYPDTLRRIVLVASDMLMRAASASPTAAP